MDWRNKLFIVSCQALKDEPLFGEGIMIKMAKAALIGGADAIRTSQVNNIKDIMTLGVPVIGLIKKDYPDSQVFITPTIKEAKELIETKVDVIAIDATTRKRPKESLEELFNFLKENKKPNQLIMADCSNKEDVKNAIKLGFDIIGTTMRGYTNETKGQSNVANDYEFITWCSQQLKETNITLIAEGGLNTPDDAANALSKGAHSVVVGSAITRPRLITKAFYEKIEKEKRK